MATITTTASTPTDTATVNSVVSYHVFSPASPGTPPPDTEVEPTTVPPPPEAPEPVVSVDV